MIYTVLVGVNHHRNAYEGDRENMTVELVRDTENQFSMNAVAVKTVSGDVIGHVVENYFPTGFKHLSDEAIKSPELIKDVLDKNIEFEAFIMERKVNGAVIAINLKEEEVLEPIEEDIMDKWEIGTDKEEFTLVGCGHNAIVKSIGDKVSIGVYKYAIDVDGTIKGTASAFNEDGKVIGVFPQSEQKFKDCEEMGAKYIKGDKIKNDYASDLLETDGYVIVDISKDGRYVKCAKNVTEVVVEETTTEEVVVEEETVDEVSVETETEAEPVNESTEDSPMEDVPMSVVNAEKRIKEIKDAISVKKDEIAELENDLAMWEEELQRIERRNTLIKAIKKDIFGCDDSQLEAILKIVQDDVKNCEEEENPSSSSSDNETHSVDEWEKEAFEDALREIKSYDDLKSLYRDCNNPSKTIGKICLDIEHINLENQLKNGFIHKRFMEKLDDIQIAELNMAIHRQIKVIKGILDHF